MKLKKKKKINYFKLIKENFMFFMDFGKNIEKKPAKFFLFYIELRNLI